MRYRLRTLLIATAIGPPILAAAFHYPHLAGALIATELFLVAMMLFAYRFLL